jgi:hypothetical protein
MARGDDKQATRLFVNDRLAPFPDIPDAFRERTFAFRPKPTDSVEEVGDEAVDPLAPKRLD